MNNDVLEQREQSDACLKHPMPNREPRKLHFYSINDH